MALCSISWFNFMPNDKITKTILAIRPGRREMGIAVLEGYELLFWGVMGFRNISGQELLGTVERRLHSLIDIYHVDMLAVEQPTAARLKASPMLGTIGARVTTVALTASLDYYPLNAKNVRRRLCGSPTITRRTMAEHIISLYPHLTRYHHCTSQWQQLYWMPMFVAISVGLVCLQSQILCQQP